MGVQAKPVGRAPLAIASAATALLLLDVTVVNVALPAIGADLGASFDELQWVVDAYALMLAGTLLAAGSVADRVGRRRVMRGGLAVFAAASALCALAWSPLVLDLARAAQGAGAAAMFATSLALLAAHYTGRERAAAFAVWGAVTGAALAVGPVVGGALVDGPGWRWIFWINVPAALGLAWLAARHAAESRDPAARPTDWPGMALLTAACFLVTGAVIRGGAEGWGSTPIVAAFALGALAAFGFAVRMRARGPDALLDPRLLRDGSFTGTALVAFAQSFALYPMFLFLAIWMQDVLGHSPLETGLRLLPVTVVLLVVAPLGGRWAGRTRLGVPLATGLALIGCSLLAMRAVEPGSDWTALLPGFVIGGAGVGIISPALAAAMIAVLSDERAGLASGINNTFRQLGIAVGIAVLGAIFEHHAAAGSRAAYAHALDAIFLVAALVALAAAPAAFRLVRVRV